MSEVVYYRGVTIESEADIPRLTIEGERLKIRSVGDTYECDEAPGLSGTTLRKLAFAIVDGSAELVSREAAQQAHLSILARGVNYWNAWRRHHPEVRPMLFDAPLSSEGKPAMLQAANFANALLIGADLRHAHLEGANFHEANLGRANLRCAHLNNANFCTTDLFDTDLRHADLTGANLQGTQLTLTRFEGATLVGCTIYGISAWDLKLGGAKQGDLIVLYPQESADTAQYEEGRFVVHDLQYAQFVYSLLQNQNVRNAIQALTSKIVVILGRFDDGGLTVLQRAASVLREQHGYVPIIFNFDRPRGRNYLETVKALIALSRFVLADLSGRSVGAELTANVRDFRLPFVPILERGRKAYSLFEDFENDNTSSQVLKPVVRFDDAEHLAGLMKSHIVDPAEKWIANHEQRPPVDGGPAAQGA